MFKSLENVEKRVLRETTYTAAQQHPQPFRSNRTSTNRIPRTSPAPHYTITIIAVGIAVIIAVAIATVAIILMGRKH